jgi:DNA-directed RNA polymerase subunit L
MSKNFETIEKIVYPYKDSWDSSKNYVEIHINGVELATINSLRRVIIAESKSVGFKTEPSNECQIQIFKNDTSLHNQFISHRIGMIPVHLKTEIEANLDDYEFIIDVVNKTNFIMNITTKDFKIRKISENKFLPDTLVKKILPPDPLTGEYILITKLKPKYYNDMSFIPKEETEKYLNETDINQIKLHLKGKCSYLNGKVNGSFCPTSCCIHMNKVDENLVKINREKYVEEQIKADTEKGLTPLSKEKLVSRFDTSFKDRYFCVNSKGEPNRFIFKIESVGVYRPLLIFNDAIHILKEKINNFIENCITKNADEIEIIPSQNIMNAFDICVNNETDTLGNIIQNNLVDFYCNYGSMEHLLDFISYKKVHPLENKIVFTIKPRVELTEEKIIQTILEPGCKEIIKILSHCQKKLANTPQFISELKNENLITF